MGIKTAIPNKDKCCRCGIRRSELRNDDLQSYKGEPYCEECRIFVFFFCDECSQKFPIEQGMDFDGDSFCKQCHKKVSDMEHDPDEIDEDDVIKPHWYKPKPRFLSMGPKPKDGLFFGIELELEVREDCGARKVANEVLSTLGKKNFYAKGDGSIYHGFELVSHPFTIEWWNDKGKPLLSKAMEETGGFFDDGKEHVGLHVHLSKEAFTRFHLRKFLEFFYAIDNRRFIDEIANRKSNYAKFDLEHYGTPKTAEDRRRKESKKLCAISRSSIAGSKYQAVNTRPGRTVEIRVFKSSTRNETIDASISFCHAAFCFSKEAGLTSLDWSDFLSWLWMTNENKYRSLRSLIANNERLYRTSLPNLCQEIVNIR